MNNIRLLITGPFDEGKLSDIGGKGFDIHHLSANAPIDELMAAVEDIEAYILGGNEVLDENLLGWTSALKIIIFLGEQPETFMAPGIKDELQKRNIALESTPAVSTNAVAEMACALILSALRRIPYLVQNVRDHHWPSCTVDELAGKTLGIYGMGRIGYTVVKRLSGFELDRVLYFDVVQSERAEKDLNAQKVEMDRLFAESDVISIHAPLTPETRGIVDSRLLRLMKPTAILVNTARAGIVDPDALRKALEERWISGAAFDGYYIEGQEFTDLGPDNDPYGLLKFTDRFFVTSHQGFNTYNAIRTASEKASEKVVSFFQKHD